MNPMNQLPRSNQMDQRQPPPQVPPQRSNSSTDPAMEEEHYRQLMNYLIQELNQSIVLEATSIDFYNRLAEVAPNEVYKQNILKIVEDEKEHLRLFINLFLQITGNQPVYEISKVVVSSFEEGLITAYERALKDFNTYRNIYLLIDHPMMRDIFLRAFTDEMEHATRLNRLRTELHSNRHTMISNPVKQDLSVNTPMRDYGPEPLAMNIHRAATQNNHFRRTLWTGNHLQVTLMSLNAGEEIGLEIHPTIDQFLRIEEGEGLVQMGNREEQINFEKNVTEDDAIIVPAGKWHNVKNTGNRPLKVYSIYAPPAHPAGTIHRTAEEAHLSEQQHFY